MTGARDFGPPCQHAGDGDGRNATVPHGTTRDDYEALTELRLP